MSYKNKQCEAITAKGFQCKSGAMPGMDYCGPHSHLQNESCYFCDADNKTEVKLTDGRKVDVCLDCQDDCRNDDCTVESCEEIAYRDEALCKKHMEEADALHEEILKAQLANEEEDKKYCYCGNETTRADFICDYHHNNPTDHTRRMRTMGPVTYITITGHRPDKLGGYRVPNPTHDAVFAALERKMLNAVEKFGDVVFRIGMAQGADQMAAWICVKHVLRFHAYPTSYGQESPWPTKAQDAYRKLLGFAEKIYYTHAGPYPGKWVYQARNKMMVDGADGVKASYILSVYNETPGGTANCINYAKEVGVIDANNKGWVNINPNNL